MLKRVSQVVGRWANPCNRQTYGGVLVQSIPSREMHHLGWTPLWRSLRGTRPPQGPVSAAITDGPVLANRRSRARGPPWLLPWVSHPRGCPRTILLETGAWKARCSFQSPSWLILTAQEEQPAGPCRLGELRALLGTPAHHSVPSETREGEARAQGLRPPRPHEGTTWLSRLRG